MYVNSEGRNVRGSRPSGWGKELDDENALVNWKINRAMEGLAKRPDLIARTVALKEDDKDGWADMREQAINSGRGDVAADIGTAIHSMTERWEDPNDDFDPGEPYTAHLTAYSNELERLGLVSELFEFHVVNTTYNAAGTADRLFRATKPLLAPDGTEVPVGTLLIGDLKTGKKLDFSKPGYAIQLAIYANGERYNVETDEFMETPEINKKWGLLVHQPSDTPVCQCLWVDLEVGDFGAYLVQQVRMWRAMWRSGEYSMPESHPVPAAVIAAVAETVEEPQPTPDQMIAELATGDEMRPWLQARIRQIGQHPEAKNQLAYSWPEGLPTPKQGIDAGQAVTIDRLLDKIEADHSLPFVSGDPRAVAASGGWLRNPTSTGAKES